MKAILAERSDKDNYEPKSGIEPPTPFLPRTCSATELLGLKYKELYMIFLRCYTKTMKYVVLLMTIIVFCSSFLFFIFFRESTGQPIDKPEVNKRLTNIDANNDIRILLGGDVMLGRSVTVESLDKMKDSTFPFRNIQPLFSNADLVFLNLETPIITNCPRQTSGMVFCAPSEMLSGISGEKTLVTLANNHTLNHGEMGILETIDHLNERNISHTGRTKLVVKTIQGIRFGFLGFDKDQQNNPVMSESEIKLITDSRQAVDVLLVALHWGVEYNAHPTKGQITLAEKLSALDVDVIVGHHPHWVQDVTTIGKTTVFYSLGNLVFDQMWSEETRKGLLVKLTYHGKNLKKQELIHTYIKEIGQPTIVSS